MQTDFLQPYVDHALTTLGIPIQDTKDLSKIYTKLHHPFRLPIQCLRKEFVHDISQNVATDLELVSTPSSETKGMYESLFTPTNKFGSEMIQEWSRQMTSDTLYLEETQDIIAHISDQDEKVDCERIMEIWNAVKSPKTKFLEHYCYMDWELLLDFNRSSHFMQLLFVTQMMSPIMSFIIPFFMLLLPFVILKIRGISLDFSTYCSVLQDLAKNHFIGRMMSSTREVSMDKLFYIIVTAGVYVMQIVQNINICRRFYSNVELINRELLDLRKYIDCTTKSMGTFLTSHSNKLRHAPFCKEMFDHMRVLESIGRELDPITPFTYSWDKSCAVGEMMRCYYELHASNHYEIALRYSFGWNGYLDNLRGVKGLSLAMATFQSQGKIILEDQIYPSLARDQDSVSNTCNLTKNNIILTGPNASGKTTLLKTTAINVIFTQQVGCGFYKSCAMTPYTHIHSYLNIPDTQSRDSLFQAEARRCKDILDIIHLNDASRHFCIFDELYSGTNPLEASKAAKAFLLYLSTFPNVHFVLTTHYTSICRTLSMKCSKKQGYRKIKNMKMDVWEDDKGFVYTYRMVHGISRVQGAIKVLKDMNYPSEIINSF